MAEPASGQVLNVKELKKISDESETAKMQEILARRRKEEEEDAKARQDFMQREIKQDGIGSINSWVKRAAAQGQTELELMRFELANTAPTMGGRSTTWRKVGRRR